MPDLQTPYPGYLSPQQQLAAAQTQVTAALQPNIQAAQNAITQAQTDARNKAIAEQAAYNSVADLQGGDAQKINDLYGQAADRQATFGKGYSLGLQLLQSKAAGQANDLLAQNGQAARVPTSNGAPDVLYALGGASPASVLNNSGAAFSAAAALRPGSTRGVGAQAYQGALNEGVANGKTLAQQLQQVEGQRPNLIQQALQGLRSSQQQDYANFIQAQYLNNTQRGGAIKATGVDPVTGQPAPGYSVDPATGNVVPTTVITTRQKTRAAAVTKRNNAAVTSLANGRDWVEKQLTPGFAKEQVAQVPIQIGTTQPIKDANGHVVVPSRPVYAKQGGGTTQNQAEAVLKPIYNQVPIPKPQYDNLLRVLTSKLSTQLRRYAYKPKQIKAFAQDILNDYYHPVAQPGSQLRKGGQQLPATTTMQPNP